MSILSDFVSSERLRYADDDNNRFAIGFSQISRYHAFLEEILKRYAEQSRAFFENAKAMQATLQPGHHELTDLQMKLHEESLHLNLLVHLEIESFYLFAKICLDHIAHALEFYFGQVRKKPLDSHDDLVKNFAACAEEKKLIVTDEFTRLANVLTTDISDYRDYEIGRRGFSVLRPTVSSSAYPGRATPTTNNNLIGGFRRYFCRNWTMRRFMGRLLAQSWLDPQAPFGKQPLRHVAAVPVPLASRPQLARTRVGELVEAEPARIRLEFRRPRRPERERSSRSPVEIYPPRHRRNNTRIAAKKERARSFGSGLLWIGIALAL
jgi:hypothetical protein